MLEVGFAYLYPWCLVVLIARNMPQAQSGALLGRPQASASPPTKNTPKVMCPGRGCPKNRATAGNYHKNFRQPSPLYLSYGLSIATLPLSSLRPPFPGLKLYNPVIGQGT